MSSPSIPKTRQRLIAAAIELFGRKGRDGVSTREIAKMAGVNIAGIAYHFGGKEQLHLACAEHIAKTVQAGVGANLASLNPDLPASERLEKTLAGIAHFMLGTPGNAAIARFVLREQMDPGPAFEVLYADIMEPLHRRLCRLWAEASDTDAEAEETKLKVFGLLSQVLIYRMAEAGAVRRMGWQSIGQAEIARIVANVKETCDSLLACTGFRP